MCSTFSVFCFLLNFSELGFKPPYYSYHHLLHLYFTCISQYSPVFARRYFHFRHFHICRTHRLSGNYLVTIFSHTVYLLTFSSLSVTKVNHMTHFPWRLLSRATIKSERHLYFLSFSAKFSLCLHQFSIVSMSIAIYIILIVSPFLTIMFVLCIDGPQEQSSQHA